MSIRMKPIRALSIIKQYQSPNIPYDYMTDEQRDTNYEYRKAIETIHTVIDMSVLYERLLDRLSQDRDTQ